MKMAVLLSGGVDSSVALNLLKEQKHELTAFYLKIWLQDEFSFLGDCPWEEDLSFAHAVCEKAGVPLEVLPLQTEYWDSVVTYTIEELKEGRTPNPDMFCNSLIKFGQFYDRIDVSFEKVASGHYAKVVHNETKYVLKTSSDPIKDQTYFLAYLTQQQLSRAFFPLGDFDKQRVRELAHNYELANMDRKDSQGICFLGQIKFDGFIKHHLGELPGDIVEIESQKKLGKHKGYYFYTIGQRSGLGLSGGPWYVVKKNVAENIVFISRQNVQELNRDTFTVGKFNWVTGDQPSKENLKIKIRHGAQYYNCKLNFVSDNKANVELEKGDRGIAPGQFAVFYDDDVCLGGGIILQE